MYLRFTIFNKTFNIVLIVIEAIVLLIEKLGVAGNIYLYRHCDKSNQRNRYFQILFTENIILRGQDL